MHHSQVYIRRETMITDKIDMLKHEAAQKEANATMLEFRQALIKHFEVVDANSRSLIESRWADGN
ncbi:MAG: hypothetical protein ACFFCV_19950 [Promethearchaeota archaeon]